MKKVSLFVVAVCCILSCASMAPAGDGDGPIVIGAVIPLTGELAKFGEMQKHSYELALDEINKAGGIRGKEA